MLPATFKLPPAMPRPPAPPMLSRLTAPPLANVAVAPAGNTTAATLARSGTAPPAQLAASNQSPVAPPVHATLLKRLMLAVSPSGLATL